MTPFFSILEKEKVVNRDASRSIPTPSGIFGLCACVGTDPTNGDQNASALRRAQGRLP